MSLQDPDTTRAEQLFAAWLDRRERGEASGLDELCAAHPRESDALRDMAAGWLRLAPLLEGGGARDEQSEAEAARAVARLADGFGDRYRVEEEVARGGMGVVERVWDATLGRELALKRALPPREDLSSGAAARARLRFLEEARLTGALDHPGVVPVHDLGLDDRGRLYFTMRLVRGRELTRIFELAAREEEGWSRTRALGAVLKACETVAFAHARGVIHRDLKPSNVMVGRFGEVYVMDWGLARALERPEAAREPREAPEQLPAGPRPATLDGDVLGTAAYMAPEQARGELAEVGPRADVYSLGAILYHLLAGHPPYGRPDESARPVEVWSRVRRGPPEPLESIARGQPAELVAICERAMAREPEDRYADVEALADDLRAYLENRVVRAHRTGAAAELAKWVARNRGTAAASLAAVLLALLGLGSTALVQARARGEEERLNERLAASVGELARANDDLRAARASAEQSAALAERRADDAEAARAEAITAANEARLERDVAGRATDLLVGLFEAPSPAEARGRDVLARELLDRGAAELVDPPTDGDPAGAGTDADRRVRARLLHSIGEAYRGLGLLEPAEDALRRAAALRTAALGEDARETLETRHELASALMDRAQPDRAEEVLAPTLERARASLGRDDELTLTLLGTLAAAVANQGRLEAALPLQREALAATRRVHGAGHAEALTNLSNLGVLLVQLGRHEEAVPAFEEALAGLRAAEGDDHPLVLRLLQNLGTVRMNLGLHEEAERDLLEALELCRRVLGEDHLDTVNCKSLLGALYNRSRRLDEAEPLLLEVLDARRRLFGEGNRSTLVALINVAFLRNLQDRREDGLELYREAAELAREHLGTDDPQTLRAETELAISLTNLGRRDEAEALAADVLARTPESDPHRAQRVELLETIRR